jgi:2-iminobutanoate/2-iminopropanoate deaminase
MNQDDVRTVHTDQAPAAIGPYSQAVVHGDLVFCSGQVALDPESGELVGDDVSEQAERVLRNLDAVLKAAGSSRDRVLRTTVYLTTMADFAAVNAVYGEFFTTRPARATVAVRELPKSALVEIDCIATARRDEP